MTNKILEIENLNISFGEFQAVKDVSISISESEFVAIVGESGSGKSVSALGILRLLQEPPAKISGAINFAGNNLSAASEEEMMKIRGREISMIFQEPMTSLNPLHTIGKQISEAITTHNSITKEAVKQRVLELLEMVQLSSMKDRLSSYPHQLSGGERQRVMIAIALANNPRLLIADEPTTALDVTVQTEILSLLKRLQKQMNMSVILITHDLSLVKRIAERVYVMKNGSVVEHGDVGKVLYNPEHPYTSILINSYPKGEPEPLDKQSNVIMDIKDLCVDFPIRTGVFRRTTGYKRGVGGVNIEIHKGETIGVVGESGSGKSSLGLALVKLNKFSGKVSFKGGDILNIPKNQAKKFRRNIQFVFQDPYSSLNPRMKVCDIIAEGIKIHSIAASNSETMSIVSRLVNEVGLDENHLNRFPHELSGGQRQRVSIARALSVRPELIILDEPTSALDAATQVQVVDLLKGLQRSYGISYIFISHDLRVIKSISHQLVVLRNGGVVESGLASEIFQSPKSEYTAKLIESAFVE